MKSAAAIRILAAAGLAAWAAPAGADRERLPMDFDVPAVTYGGAGGGVSRAEAGARTHLPVVMIAGAGRDHRDWTGHNPGNARLDGGVSMYDHLLAAGFRPVELWMIDFAREGEQMCSLEEATDDLKFFLAAVMRYTGAPRVQLLAHDTGCLLARLTILKYRIAHWIGGEVYVAGPFHGVGAPPEAAEALRGYPNAWLLRPGSTLLRELMQSGEVPVFRHPWTGRAQRLRTMTLRNGRAGGDGVYAVNPDSPALYGARNLAFPALDHDGLRADADAARACAAFLAEAVAPPFDAAHDADGDGFEAVAFGGLDANDRDPGVYPGAREVPGDGVDQDCNGCDLAPWFGRDGELPPGSPAPRRP